VSDLEIRADREGGAHVECDGCLSVLLEINGMSVVEFMDKIQYIHHDCPTDEPDPLAELVRLPNGRMVPMSEIVKHLPSERDIRQ
jgi:hypothetical protein